MGSAIEINDTLKLPKGDGFPAEVAVGSRHPFRIAGRRLYHLAPVRVFLVEEVDGRWNYVGHAMIHVLTIDATLNQTSGEFEVVSLYAPEHRRLINAYEAPAGKAFA